MSASILSSSQPLSADRKYELVCQTVGSRPPAKITWWLDNKKLEDSTEKVRKRKFTINTKIETMFNNHHFFLSKSIKLKYYNVVVFWMARLVLLHDLEDIKDEFVWVREKEGVRG